MTEHQDVDVNTFKKTHLQIREGWLATTKEDILDPSMEIIDSHHHVWDLPRPRYLLDEYLEDVGNGHNIVASVFVECRAMYDKHAEDHRQSLGETSFVSGISAMSDSGHYGNTRVANAIVGHVDLTLGDHVKGILEEHVAVSAGRLKGIRSISAWHPHKDVSSTSIQYPKDLLTDKKFHAGLKVLGGLGLTFDSFVFHTQLNDVIIAAEACPDTTIILNHFGGPVGVGPFEGRRDEVFSDWLSSIERLAKYPNIKLKLGGLGMRVNGFGFHEGECAPTSIQLAAAWQPYFDAAIKNFATDRCMFESNFPVDKGYCSYDVLWNAFKRLATQLSADEKHDLFYKTAADTYRMAI